ELGNSGARGGGVARLWDELRHVLAKFALSIRSTFMIAGFRSDAATEYGASKPMSPVALAHRKFGRAMIVLAFGFAIISFRLIGASLSSPARQHNVGTIAALPKRADITDRNGVILATNLPMDDVAIDPRKVSHVAETVANIAAILPEVDRAKLTDRLNSSRNFVYVKRGISPNERQALTQLALPGLFFLREDHRVYPLGSEFAHILGYTDVDNNGLAGIERRFDASLRQTSEPLQLSVDAGIQHVMRSELLQAKENHHAIGAAGVVMDVRTGEILSLVSLPDFNPNDPSRPEGDNYFNRASLGSYEMGSIFKIFTAAMALDNGQATVNSQFDVTKPLVMGKYVIHDDHPMNRPISLTEILTYSSNIGAARIAMAAGGERQQSFLALLGLLKPMEFDLPEMGRPEYPKNWRTINLMTIAYGHGIAVPPLQMVMALAAMVNGGVLIDPTLRRRDETTPMPGVRVISASTSASLRQMMRQVVTMGTGRKSNIAVYDIGGKTGTAEKIDARHTYQHNRLISSFVGVFPIDAPRYLVFAMIDEPKLNNGSNHQVSAAFVAAPLVGRVVSRIGPILAVPNPHPQPIKAAIQSSLPDSQNNQVNNRVRVGLGFERNHNRVRVGLGFE
ncbi:MAG: penicillin-binding protein 2, partial [Alphaproteobacteria bacterium]|nr:penicillin-binding protein 2 [Alphaproteobacteria bacterium]